MDIEASFLYKTLQRSSAASKKTILQLFAAGKQRSLKKGEVVLAAGKVCSSIFFVEKGYLRTFIPKERQDVNIAFTFEGEFTSNLKSLRQAVPSEYSIQSAETALVLEFNKDQLLHLYQESPELESLGRGIVEQLLIREEEHSTFFKLYTPKERYAFLQKNKPELLQRVSLSQLASYLGVARETLSRIRKEA